MSQQGSKSGGDAKGPAVTAEAYATVQDVFAAAQARLEPAVWDFLEGGAGDEVSLRRNRMAFNRWEFRPHHLGGGMAPCTDVTFLGVSLSVPVLTAPFGVDGLFHPEGQVAVARANQRMGTASIVPELCSFPMEEVAAAAPAAARFLQLHPAGPEDNFLRMAARAIEAGFCALCVTIDCPVPGWRERNRRNGYRPPRWAGTGNYREHGSRAYAMIDRLFATEGATWSWSKLERVIARLEVPVMLKGVLTAEDARLARDVGARAVLVSNHGGRQLDGAPASIDQLPEVVEAVGGDLEIALDSGVRRGSDILKSLALGASVVVCGRAPAAGLAAGGEAGVFASSSSSGTS